MAKKQIKKQTKTQPKKQTKTKVDTKPKKKSAIKTKKTATVKKSVSEPKKEVNAPVKEVAKEAPKAVENPKTVETPKAPETAKPVTKLHAKDYRRMARETIKPIKGSFAVTYFVYFILVGAITGIFSSLYLIGADPKTGLGIGFEIGSSLTALFTLLTAGPFAFSFIYMAQSAHYQKKQPKIGDIFWGFKRFGQSLGVYIITRLFTVLWSLLLIVPGIIKYFAYSLSTYIALDNPNKSILDCITESRKKMKGHKWQLFCLLISHIGWFLLIVITLGIMSFWVLPKLDQAKYKFYLHITNQD